MSAVDGSVHAIANWFESDPEPTLLGQSCDACGNVSFPPTLTFCPNPRCRGREFTSVRLSSTGTIWSFTDAQYQPPPPYIISGDEYEPFALAAVALEAERMVIVGQVARGFAFDDLTIGQTVRLVVEPLYQIEGTNHLMYRWMPVAADVG